MKNIDPTSVAGAHVSVLANKKTQRKRPTQQRLGSDHYVTQSLEDTVFARSEPLSVYSIFTLDMFPHRYARVHEHAVIAIIASDDGCPEAMRPAVVLVVRFGAQPYAFRHCMIDTESVAQCQR